MTNILPKMEINNCSLDQLLEQASQSPRLRQSKDMRTSAADSSQRMLNALMPGTKVPVHRHRLTDETVICLKGKIDEIIFEETTDAEGNSHLQETARIHLNPSEGNYGCQVPQNTWHTVEVFEPSVIFEAKDGPYTPATPEDVRNL